MVPERERNKTVKSPKKKTDVLAKIAIRQIDSTEKVERARFVADKADEKKILKQLATGRLDISRCYDSKYLSQKRHELDWESSARFAKAVEKQGRRHEGRNPDGSWPPELGLHEKRNHQ